jgi:outer membrane lipase/esterase
MRPISKHLCAPLTLPLILAASLSSVQAKVFTFGDSYSDNGNLAVVTGGAQPGPNYWDGRYTNGWTLAERITFRLTNASPGRSAGLNGVQYPVGTSATGGIDFAHGGATALTRSTLPKHLGVWNQVRYFQLEASAKRISVARTDTAILWAGLNDYLAYNATNTTQVSGFIADNMVGSLVATRVGTVAVLNLPNMGDLPGWIDGPKRTSLNALTAAHNSNLATRLTARQAISPSTKLVLVDVNRALALAHQGLAGGFTVTRPGQNGSASGNCLGDGKVMWDCPANYLYYDYAHLTSSGHEYLASITQDRLNATATQPLQASLSAVAVGVTMASQSRALSARFASLQHEDIGETARGFGGLDVFSFGSGIEPVAETLSISQTYDPNFGAGADLRWGEWVAGAAAFRSSPGDSPAESSPNFGLTQSSSGVSAYLGWVAPDATFALSATHAMGEQETERLTTIKGLARARGQAEFSATAIEATGSAVQAWGTWSLTGEAALRYDDTQVAAYQESGTLGLSDTLYDPVEAKGLSSRAGVTFGYDDEDLSVKLGAHLLARLDGNAPLEAALPVAIPGQDSARFDTDTHAPLLLGDHAAAATFAMDWRVAEGARLTVDAAAVATPGGDAEAGVAFGAKIEF